MIDVVEVFPDIIVDHTTEFFHDAIAEVGKDPYHGHARCSDDERLLIHWLAASSGCFQVKSHRKDRSRSCLRNLAR